MSETFNNPLDIANRALDHCGIPPLSPGVWPSTDNSTAAERMNRLYDKLRKAELRRNVWEFSIKKTALRPVGQGYLSTAAAPIQLGPSMIFAPAAWSATYSYAPGEMVAFGNQIWVAKNNSVNSQPGSFNDADWDTYFGSLLAQPYDNTVGYYSGELVYELSTPVASTSPFMTVAGGAVAKAYMSLVDGNIEDPGTPDQWSATIVQSTNPNFPGQVNNNDVGQPLFYPAGAVVQYNGFLYMSLIDNNYDNEPDLSPAPYNNLSTYAAGAYVAGIDGNIYYSLVSSNTGHQPTTDPGTHWQNTGQLVPWTPSFSGTSGSSLWMEVTGTLTNPNIRYPVGTGASQSALSKHVFFKPVNFLRRAPQDPKAGSWSPLGAPSGLIYDDWELESGFITSSVDTVMLIRFAADVTLVTSMDDMFCEALAARIGLEACEPLTQSTEKIKTIQEEYQKFMTEARLVNGIETGAEEPPEDDYITCRV